ncbi:MAG TPA: DUF5050 domain-containing protein [Candidatus Cryosericum sp.]|nr:DUF5050 domain-containing protein [Candidatus Cryosericum sp.]
MDKTKKLLCLLFAAFLACSLFACAPAAETPAEPAANAETAAHAASDPIEAAATADELNALIEQYQAASDFDGVYRAALKLTELEPDNAAAYLTAAGALLALNEQNEQEMKRILALGMTNAPDSADTISGWMNENGLGAALKAEFVPDYTDVSQINTEGTTPGNLTNAMKWDGSWVGGLVTSQAGWVYFSRVDNDYALYKMRADGSELQALSNVRASSLNVVGDWLYFCNFDDNKCPYRMRTDGSGLEKLADFSCSFLSVAGDWVYCDGSTANGLCLSRFKTDGSEETVLFDGPIIFCCEYQGYVYFDIKSMDEGGFLRIRTDGTDKQQITPYMPMFYCIANDRIYFVDESNPNMVKSMNLDGSDVLDVFQSNDSVIALNISDKYLFLAKGVSFDNDGFTLSRAIQIVSLDTGEVVREWESSAEPLCVAEGLFFLTENQETMAWTCFDLNTFELIPVQ